MMTPNKLLHEFKVEPSSLVEAAELLREDYLHDQELTALLILDSEPFQPPFIDEQVSDESSQNSPIS